MDNKQAILDHFEDRWADFYGHYLTLPAQRDGKVVKVLSPFREETKPSFDVHLEGEYAGRWKDWATGEVGDIFSFYAYRHDLDCRVDFPTVLEGIAQEFGISVDGKAKAGRKLRRKRDPEEVLRGFQDALKNSEVLSGLKQQRGLSDETIVHFNLGRWQNDLVFPVRDASGAIVGYKVHHGPHLKPAGTKAKTGEGIKVQLYPLSNLDADPLVICEGEPDVWRLHTAGIRAVTGTAGAGAWKEEWADLLTGKDIAVAGDNDDAGRKMQEEVIRALKGKARRLRCVEWPEGLTKGFDITDWLQSGKAFAELPLREVKVKRLTLTEMKQRFAGWLHFDRGEDAVLDMFLGAVVANRFSGDPVWIFVVGPPGGTKTEVLRSLSEWSEVYTLSTLTASTLISGLVPKDGIDPSLLPKLDGKVLVIKDFTAILDMHREARQQILGDLRDAYDGEMAKAFGSEAGTRRYKSKFGLVAAVTPVIDSYTSIGQQLGERFIKFRLTESGAMKRVRKALGNSGRETDMRRELAEAAEGVLLACATKEERQIAIGEDLEGRLIDLADILARLRSVVSRNGYTKTINYVPVPEIGTRLVKQFGKLARGIAAVRGKSEVGEDEFRLIRRIARDTLPSKRRLIVHTLFRLYREGNLTTKQIAEEMNMPVPTTQYALEDLCLLEIVKREGETTILWRMKSEVSQRLEDLDFFGDLESFHELSGEGVSSDSGGRLPF